MTENEFILQDRIVKIKSMNELYDLENNSYISFSGGKDSTVLSHLIDMALPNNQIPRVYINTGIEYSLMVAHVERERELDARIIVVYPKQNIKAILEQYGYPFKSKEHSYKLGVYQHSKRVTQTVQKYLNDENDFGCPKILKYQFDETFELKVSDKCCYKLKKEPSAIWQKENKKTILLTGMRRSEGGQRANKDCAVFKDGNLKKFHPLMPINDEFIEWFIDENKIELCELYSAPFNFQRTGCKGCPYSLKLQSQLDIMKMFLPNEEKQCEFIFGPVYSEYRKVGYRLRNNIQPEFNF